jgi:hypothetical protein
MAEIKISGRMKVKTFQADFIEKFPYLVPTMRMSDGSGIDNDITLAAARVKARGEYEPSGEAELSVNGNLSVGSFEKRFKEAFGIDCEICYESPGGRMTKTNEAQNGETLASLNAELQSKGCQKIVL